MTVAQKLLLKYTNFTNFLLFSFGPKRVKSTASFKRNIKCIFVAEFIYFCIWDLTVRFTFRSLSYSNNLKICKKTNKQITAQCQHLHLLLSIAPDSVRKMFKYFMTLFSKSISEVCEGHLIQDHEWFCHLFS